MRHYGTAVKKLRRPPTNAEAEQLQPSAAGTMETMELKYSSEMFGSPIRQTRPGSSSELTCGSIERILDEHFLAYEQDQYGIFNDLSEQGSVTDEESIIDIESIDELRSIMKTPERSSQIHRPFQQSGEMRPARVRHNTEQLVNEMVDMASTIDGDDDTFSLLGIDGIEAEDLETLFHQFEGAVTSPTFSPVRSKGRPRPLTLEDYRRTRGINGSGNEKSEGTARKIGFEASDGLMAGTTVTIPSKSGSIQRKEPVVLQSQRSMPAPALLKNSATLKRSSSSPLPLDELKAMPLPLQHPPAVIAVKGNAEKTLENMPTANRTPAAQFKIEKVDLCRLISLDHDYCLKSAPPQRNIKEELTMLLNRIPEYIAQSKSSQSTTLSTDPSNTDKCSCESRAVQISHQVSAPAAKPLEMKKPLGLPKAYAVANRGRAKKRRHCRSKERSVSCSESTDNESSSCSSCDSCCSPIRDKKRYSQAKRRRHERRHRPSNQSRPSRARHHQICQRRRRKSGRSSQSVSPCSHTTSSVSRSPSPPSPDLSERRRKEAEEAHNKAMAERRVVYVGGIDSNYTKADLRKRFGGFGEIESVKTRLRDNAENYGFVTFYSKADAYAAVEKGNDVYGPKFNIGFGGRRTFCDTEYADLDGCLAVKEEWAPSFHSKKSREDDFDKLLQRSIRKLHK